MSAPLDRLLVAWKPAISRDAAIRSGSIREIDGAAEPLASAMRSAAAGLTALILLAQVPVLVQAWQLPDWNGHGAADYELYMEATRRWLSGGQFYLPHQLSGTYQVTFGDVLYPPVALWLFVPFTLLPGFLWWAVPLGVTAWVVWRLNPAPVAWPLMALCLWEPVQIHLVSGNPDLWATAFLGLGTLYRWPAVLAFIKPSVAIFALFGIRDRRWWYGLVGFCAFSVVLLPMWLDWLNALLNSRSAGLLYSWQEAPLMLIPIIAWLARPGGRLGLVETQLRAGQAMPQLSLR